MKGWRLNTIGVQACSDNNTTNKTHNDNSNTNMNHHNNTNNDSNNYSNNNNDNNMIRDDGKGFRSALRPGSGSRVWESYTAPSESEANTDVIHPYIHICVYIHMYIYIYIYIERDIDRERYIS